MEKICPKCGKHWNTDELLTDTEVKPIGMIVQSEAPVTGVYFFQHRNDSCQTTFTVPIEAFTSHLPTTPPKPMTFGTDSCPGHCRKLSQLASCHSNCHHAPYRQFILELKKKKDAH